MTKREALIETVQHLVCYAMHMHDFEKKRATFRYSAFTDSYSFYLIESQNKFELNSPHSGFKVILEQEIFLRDLDSAEKMEKEIEKCMIIENAYAEAIKENKKT